ncbi:uncharacterized protein LOC141672161 [Apium graveolens]|uniref:uncharacterized protein LOC141672161 n=1 Tax=Apium graveolens TaxID=4045 RepID=UPI003D7A53C3
MELKSSSSQLHSVSTFDQTVDLNDHLFSSIVTLYILIFLYFPTIFLNIVFSPVFVSTGVLLVYLLRLGAIQDNKKESHSLEALQSNESSYKTKPNQAYTLCPTEEEGKMYTNVMSTTKNTELSNDETYTLDSCDFKFENVENSFVEWNVKAPLEIIYEDDEEEDNDKNENRFKGIERYPSLSLYYPKSDSDCSSDDDFAMDMNWESTDGASETFRWGEKGEELIEIALDGKRRSQFFNDEEDSLIEIDISPGRNNEFAGLY